MNDSLKANNREAEAFLVIDSNIHPLIHSSTKLGRKLDNDIVLHDPMVSRYHAELRFDGGKFYLVDLNSTTGTLINQEEVAPSDMVRLYTGDIILIANAPLMFIHESISLSNFAEVNTGALTSQF